ncbi:methyltransferase domain-containing protein [Oceanirhabdus seepicola]|uniref:Methyltransferase domain-containing protein n=1 Tax=Oceanirhabdus seepicola TaxID=2828781 RepID=A0A9J6P0N8_9CLOT|nr:methyltransferase domain-containing protein [Oceanirhabdus seepicola]MCM1990274.1 methyltransferase domain-containing protein [Oceanirhabdus seepicola]
MDDNQINSRYYGDINSKKTQQLTRERIHWLCKQVNGEKILDIGCSQGITSILLGREGFKVTGIDIEQNKIEYALEELNKESDIVRSNVKFANEDCTVINAELGEFDTVILGEILEHFSNPDKLLRVTFEYLNKDGKIIITVPHGYHSYHDHKSTFYIGNFINLVGKYFQQEYVKIQDKTIYYVGKRKSSIDEKFDLQNCDSDYIQSILNVEEEAFLQFEKENEIYIANKNQRIEKMGQQNKENKKVYTKYADFKGNEQQYISYFEGFHNELTLIKNELNSIKGSQNDIFKNELIDSIKKSETVLLNIEKINDDYEKVKSEFNGLQDKSKEILGELRERNYNDVKGMLDNQVIKKINVDFEEIKNEFNQLHDKLKVIDSDQVKSILDNIISDLRNDVCQQSDVKEINAYKTKVKQLEKNIVSLDKKVESQKQSLDKVKKSLQVSRQTIDYLKNNSSVRYRIGDAVVEARKSFKKAVKLPVTIMKLYKDHKKGKFSDELAASIEIENTEVKEVVSTIKSTEGCIIFTPTNGAGLGHITRLLAIARRIKKLQPERKIIFFATSSAMHLILQEGFLGYHLPSKMLFPEDTSAKQWNMLLKEQLGMVMKLHKPSMLVFDGAYPYAGLIASMKEAKDLQRVWVKRGQQKKGTESIRDEKEKYFHHIIKPGEAGEEKTSSKDNHKVCEPIVYLDKEEVLDRELVRKQWRIPKDAKLVYVQLGAGNINDIDSTLGKLIYVLRKREDIYVVLGESIIGNRLNIYQDRIIVIRDYPNSRYFKAFDLAVSATGYNTYHELMYFGVPTIFIPNTNTKTDDQVARAKNAEKQGAAVTLIDSSIKDFEKAISKILDDNTNIKMREAAYKMIERNGADEVGEYLLNILKEKEM